MYIRLGLFSVLSLSLSVLLGAPHRSPVLAQMATFEIQMRFDCHPSHSQDRAESSVCEAGTWLNGFVGSFHGTQLHKCQLWGLKLVPQHRGWPRRKEEGARPMLLLCMPFVVRVAVSLLLCGCLLLLYTLDMLYLTISITLCSPSLFLALYSPICSLASRRASKGEILVGVS